jgi:hypothetical protein
MDSFDEDLCLMDSAINFGRVHEAAGEDSIGGFSSTISPISPQQPSCGCGSVARSGKVNQTAKFSQVQREVRQLMAMTGGCRSCCWRAVHVQDVGMCGSGNSKGDGPQSGGSESSGGESKRDIRKREWREKKEAEARHVVSNNNNVAKGKPAPKNKKQSLVAAGVAESAAAAVAKLDAYAEKLSSSRDEVENIKAEKAKKLEEDALLLKYIEDNYRERCSNLNITFDDVPDVSRFVRNTWLFGSLVLALYVYSTDSVNVNYVLFIIGSIFLGILLVGASNLVSVKHRYVGKGKIDKSFDCDFSLRADAISQMEMKHTKPGMMSVTYSHAWYFLGVPFFWRSVKLTVSLEALSQIGVASNLSLAANDADSWTRIMFTANKLQSVNLNRYMALHGVHPIQDSALVAYALYKQMIQRRALLPFPRSPAAK